MGKRALHAFVLALGAVCAVAHAADRKRDVLVDLLDPSRPGEDRQRALAVVDKLALEGERQSQYVLGSLYRVGDKLPGNLVAADPDKAWRYLSNAAAHGEVRAMAKMAEAELERQHALEAMLWAQLYAHYSLRNPQTHASKQPRDGYLADLLRRVYKIFDPAQEDLMKQHFAAFLAAHDADIKAGITAWSTALETGDTQPRISTLRYDMRVAPREDSLADFVVAFAPDGSAAQVWMLDAVPDLALGRELGPVAMHMRVNAIDAAEGMRYALLPLDFSTNRYELKTP